MYQDEARKLFLEWLQATNKARTAKVNATSATHIAEVATREAHEATDVVAAIRRQLIEVMASALTSEE